MGRIEIEEMEVEVHHHNLSVWYDDGAELSSNDGSDVSADIGLKEKCSITVNLTYIMC